MADEAPSHPAAVRRQQMLEMITVREFVKVGDLAGAFGVSDVTIRTDLDALHRARLVRRIRGGAVPRQRSVLAEPSFEEAMSAATAEKQRIAAYAAGMVRSGMSVLLDVGTTTTAIANALVARTDLTDVVVVTNGLNTALALEPAIPRISVAVTGGTLRALQHSLVAPLAGEVLDKLHADLAFIGCTGVDRQHGITNINLPESEVKARMVASAATPVVVADSRKLGQVHIGHVAGLGEFASLVTGVEADPDVVDALTTAGLHVVTA
ncbi:MAG: DeoR/GlpR family DNA-binding transcription regulator [Cellulomonadaceae bacterium]